MTEYDDEHFTTYIGLLDTDAAGASKDTMARTVLGVDPATEPERAANNSPARTYPAPHAFLEFHQPLIGNTSAEIPRSNRRRFSREKSRQSLRPVYRLQTIGRRARRSANPVRGGPTSARSTSVASRSDHRNSPLSTSPPGRTKGHTTAGPTSRCTWSSRSCRGTKWRSSRQFHPWPYLPVGRSPSRRHIFTPAACRTAGSRRWSPLSDRHNSKTIVHPTAPLP